MSGSGDQRGSWQVGPGQTGNGPGVFRRRHRTRLLTIFGAALITVVLLGTFFSVRAFSGEDSSNSSSSSQASKSSPNSQNQQLASSHDSAGQANNSAAGGKSGGTTSASGQGDSGSGDTAIKGSMVKLGEYKTDYRYSDSKARRENLKIAANSVNDTVLKPGQTFSMNSHLMGLNYKEAKVFADGGETTALGGGLCQVTSTVYMAAQYAGMQIVERTPHYSVLPYIRPGFDATVWFGGQGIPELDMKFKNTDKSNVVVKEYITDKGILKAEIWGQPNGKEVTMRSERDFKDTTKGIKWSTYKTVKQDGKVVRSGLLHEDLYSFPPPEAMNDKGLNKPRVGAWSAE